MIAWHQCTFKLNIPVYYTYINGFQPGFHGTLGLHQCSPGLPPEVTQML